MHCFYLFFRALFGNAIPWSCRSLFWKTCERLWRQIFALLSGQHETQWRYAHKTTKTMHHSRRKPEWVTQELEEMYRETRLSMRKLSDAFNRTYAATHGMTVSKTYVAKVIRHYRYSAAKLSTHCKRNIPTPVPRNDTWGLDMTGKGDTQGAVHPILGVIDHGSRMALAMHPLRNRTALTLLKALIAVIDMAGMPRTIKTDNEACFTSKLFRFGLAWLGVEHRRSQPGHPWQNGRIERLFGTLKEKLDQLVVSDAMGLQQALGAFQFWYNSVRTHQHLNGWTPSEVWHDMDPYRRAPLSITLFSAWDGLLTGYHMRR